MKQRPPQKPIDGKTRAGLAAISAEPPPRFFKQIWLFFGVVGLAGTAVDFTVLNIVIYAFNQPLIAANVVSSTVAMGFNYFANKRWVFNKARPPLKKHVAAFVIISLIGIYLIQNITLWVLNLYPYPQQTTVFLLQLIPGVHHLPDSIIYNNVSKGLAGLVASIWNFLMYRRFVFRH